MSGYGAVSLSDPASSQGGKELNLWIPKGFASFLEGGGDAKPNESPVAESSKLKFKINAESVRFIAYCFFWFMCFFAITLTKTVVAPLLLAGPDDGSTCPPFQITYEKDNVTILHDKSHGFNVANSSHLQDAFGFANVSKRCLLCQDGCLVEIASSN
jgi:hypothetical protein